MSQEVENVWLSGLYPVNSMRNRALANAKTDVGWSGVWRRGGCRLWTRPTRMTLPPGPFLPVPF